MGYYKPQTYRAKDSIGYLVRRTSSALMALMEDSLAAHEISFAQWVILIWLRDGLARTAAELARGLGHDPGATTRLLDKLQRRKLIVRKRSAEDRRVIELELSAAGRRALDKVLPLVVDRLNTVLQRFNRAEVEQLQSLLGRLLDNLAREPRRRDD